MKNYCLFVSFALLFLLPKNSFSQNPCGASTPVFNVNLSAAVNASWTSPMVQRADTCCGATNPDVCIEFIVTLNPNSTGIIFSITAGAVPPGALYYQVGCGPVIPVGTPLCLSGVGPHIITFCKPGNNSNEYTISAVPNVSVSPDITLNNGCSGTIGVTGMQEPTVTWTSVFPGPSGAYNSFLSCTAGCDTVTVTPGAGYPPYVDYCVCGLTIDGCSNNPFCDTIRVYFNPALSTSITPVNPVLCFGNPGLTVTANTTGGSPPYTYLWSTGATTQSIFVGPGTYSVTVQDTSNCPPSTATVTVTTFTAAITANAGADMMVCAQSPSVTLNGTVTGVTTGIWSGGSGTYSPSNTTLNATYTPSASEIAKGSATLILTTTNNGPCPAGVDTVLITINNFNASVDPSYSNVTCNGFNNGTATVTVSGGSPPFTYSWSTNPVQTTSTATNLGPGTYTCIITDANGCSASVTATITQPPPLALNAAGFPATCFNTCNGQSVVIPSGGSGGYMYQWMPGNSTSAAVTGLCPGTYTITVTDIGGCTLSDTVTVTQPPPLVITSLTSTTAYCNMSTGTADVAASGGTGSYTYQWLPGNQVSASVSNLATGNYTVNVTDANGCVTSGTVSVGNAPGPSLAVTNVTPPLCTASCDGSATVNATSGFSPYQYNWLTAPQQSGNTATNLCAGTYSVIVTDSAGCYDTSTVTITAPSLVVLTPGPTSTICMGQQTLLTASASGGTPSYSYTWSPSGPVVSPNTNTTYTVIATDANGCQSVPQQVSVLVYPPLNVTISGNLTACQNTSVTLVANGGGGNSGPYTYLWQPGNYSGQNYTVFPVSTTTYTVIISDGCSPVSTATFTVTVPPNPVASFTFSDSTGCGQACVDFTNTTPNTQSVYWLMSDGFTSSSNTPNHCFSTGTFNATLIVTDNNGCHDTVSIPNFLTVHPNPVASFLMGPQPTTVLEPNICFTDQSSNDAITWYWNFDDPNDATTSTDQNPCHVYSDTGTYCASLIITNQYGCWSTFMNCLIIEPYYSFYVPNAFTPNNDGLNDVFLPVGDDVDPSDYEMLIFDRWGNLLFSTNSPDQGWDGTVKQSSKLAQIDTYVWKLNFTDHAGFKHKMIGHVSIIK
ncbi:MAG TPA: PKD domain-containing protein [Bacteroidia bacterium]|nr:PKD domain-containing protein [Bacteroidia bacterium]